ncbi:MAG: ComEC/Rec2 family competence protein, partial [Planctomycetota bacterium]
AALLEKLPRGALRPRAALGRLRAHLAEVIRREMPEREGPLLNTILLGRRGEMNPEDELAFTRTGAGHLLAVSGIHVMLLVGAVWWLLRSLGVRPRPAALVLIVFALAYAQLAGARTPVIRATVMACLLLGGILLGREADGPNSLGAAALLILAVWPRELFSVGFQMSFAAVFFIMGAVPALEEASAGLRRFPIELTSDAGLRFRARALRWLRLSAFSSLAATAGTMPLVVGTFGVICPWAPLVNMFAIPAAGASLAAGLALLLVAVPLPVIARVPAALAWGALRALETAVELARLLPASELIASSPPAWLVAPYYLIAGLLLWSRFVPDRWRGRAAAAALALAIPVSMSGLLPSPAPAGLRVTLLGRGRGRAALLEEPSGGSCAVWAGGSGREIADMLRAERLPTPSATLITADRREVVSGAARLILSGRAGELILPDGEALSEQLDAVAPGAARMASGWEKEIGEARLLALGAGPYTRSDGRTAPRPLMVLARRGGRGVLFADLSNGRTVSAAARQIESRGLRADVVVLGERAEPAGAALLDLLRGCGLRPLTTADYGTLRAVLEDDRIRTEHFDGRSWLPLTTARHPRNRK